MKKTASLTIATAFAAAFTANVMAEDANSTPADDCVNDSVDGIITELAGIPGVERVEAPILDQIKKLCEEGTGTKIQTTKDLKSVEKTVKGTHFSIR